MEGNNAHRSSNNSILEQALIYAEKINLSVIPIKPDKTPYIKWEPYQKKMATPREIREWWSRWPEAMIGIVTGEISRILVIDCDSSEGYEAIQKLLPDSLLIPIARTPGWLAPLVSLPCWEQDHCRNRNHARSRFSRQRRLHHSAAFS